MPKVRERNDSQERAIEDYANKSHDSNREKKRMQGRICVSFFEEELEQLKTLAEQDKRSISSFIRMQLLKSINESR